MTEKEKMLAGELYDAKNKDLSLELSEARELIHDYNALRPSVKDEEYSERTARSHRRR